MSEESEPTPKQLQGQFDFLRAVSAFSAFCLFLIVFILAGNWLSVFLHAPIGIKDNPPEPGAMVQLAETAFWPVFSCYGLLRILRWFEITPKRVLTGFGCLLIALWLLWLHWLLPTKPAGWFFGQLWFFGRLMFFFACAGLVVWLVMAVLSDAKDNRTIRAGSTEAFDKRVEYFVNKLDYSIEDAKEATRRIRDGK